MCVPSLMATTGWTTSSPTEKPPTSSSAARWLRFDYPTLSKPDKGIIGRYLAKMTGLSRAQMTRLVGQHRATGRVTDRRGGAPVRPFERRYTGADIGCCCLTRLRQYLRKCGGPDLTKS